MHKYVSWWLGTTDQDDDDARHSGPGKVDFENLTEEQQMAALLG